MTLIIIIITIIILVVGGYFIWFSNTNDKDLTNTNINSINQARNNENNLNKNIVKVEQGDLLDWPNERVSFYLPADWSYEITFDENYMEKVNILVMD